MWDLSSSEGSAPGCFMRVAQAEFYRDDNNNYDTLKLMPSVRPSRVLYDFYN